MLGICTSNTCHTFQVLRGQFRKYCEYRIQGLTFCIVLGNWKKTKRMSRGGDAKQAAVKRNRHAALIIWRDFSSKVILDCQKELYSFFVIYNADLEPVSTGCVFAVFFKCSQWKNSPQSLGETHRIFFFSFKKKKRRVLLLIFFFWLLNMGLNIFFLHLTWLHALEVRKQLSTACRLHFIYFPGVL